MKAVLYAAKSTEDKKGSIPTQLEDCREFASRERLEVIDEYLDERFSAYRGNRGPGLASARREAEENAPTALIVQHSDRLARGAGDKPGAAEHLIEIFAWAQRHEVELRSVQDDYTFTGPMARVTVAIMGERNVEDSRRKGAAVRSGIE